MKTTYKAGYVLTLDSYENDGDHSVEEVIYGLSEDDVKFYVAVAKLMKSRHWGGGTTTFGNMYEPNKEERNAFGEAVIALLKEHNRYDELVEDFSDDEITAEDVSYWFSEGYLSILGLVGQVDGQFTRAADSYTVGYLATDIHIEDVSQKFK